MLLRDTRVPFCNFILMEMGDKLRHLAILLLLLALWGIWIFSERRSVPLIR